MAYVDGVVLPVPSDKKDAYLDHAKKCADLFKQHGALSLVECWGDDIPDGKLNSLNTAVMREEGETVSYPGSPGLRKRCVTPHGKKSCRTHSWNQVRSPSTEKE